MKNNLLGKKFLSCSFCLYRFRKHVSLGFPITNFCNPGVHYETPCIYISPFATADFKHLYNFPSTLKPVVFSFMNLQPLIFANIKMVTSCNATRTHVYAEPSNTPVAYRGGVWGVQTPPPKKILKALQNHAKLNPIVKTVKNC